MNFVLLDLPTVWKSFLPLSYTRPISEMKIGIMTISEKWNSLLDCNISYITKDYLTPKFKLKIEKDNTVINSQILPNKSLIDLIKGLQFNEALYNQDNLFIAARVSNEKLISISKKKLFDEINTLKKNYISCNLSFVSKPHHIFSFNAQEIVHDFNLLTKGKVSNQLHSSNSHFGKYPLFINEGSNIKCSNFNTEKGPIYIGKNATIMEGCNIHGPFALGSDSTIKMGAKIYSDTSIGNYCKVGGELKNIVMFNYSNKGHDGFLGNAVIGEWCNLGADTNNSNLKNNYAEVKLWSYVRPGFDRTGLQYCGLIMGDHSKCGINVMFNTGTVIGVFANIFGAGYQKNFIPSFSWGGPKNYVTFKIEKTFEVAKIVMKRRNQTFNELDKNILRNVFDNSIIYRKS